MFIGFCFVLDFFLRMKFNDLTIVLIKSFPLVVEFYRELFKEISEADSRYQFNIETCFTYDDAVVLFERLRMARKRIDLVVLGLNVPDCSVDRLLFGEDIGVLVRKNHPETKIVITTAFKNNYKIHSILKNINPEGILVKSDVNIATFKYAILAVLNDSVFYSRSVSKWINSSRSCDFTLDNWDHKLLYALSQNVKTKELTQYLPFSLSAIEKRKKRIKLLFGIDDGDNRQLISLAREYGFI